MTSNLNTIPAVSVSGEIHCHDDIDKKRAKKGGVGRRGEWLRSL